MIKWYRHYWLYFVISACFLLPGLLSLLINGFRWGVDFTGGSILTLEATSATAEGQLTETIVREAAGSDYAIASVKNNDQGQAIVRLNTLTNEEKNTLVTTISQTVPVQQVSFEAVGGTMGEELIAKTLMAIALASVVLVIYLWARFHEASYGWAALLAVIHDVTIICGIFSLLGWWYGTEIDTLFVTAMLLTISFSVHDTVVIYDRIRELKSRHSHRPLGELCEAAVSATMSRSLNNSLTVVFMLTSLLLLGGVTLRSFALALLLGVVFGTYSSPFTSVPLLLLFHDRGWFVKKGQL